MTLSTSIKYHARQLKQEYLTRVRAEAHIEEAVEDILEEHPNADQEEVDSDLREELEDLFGE